MQSLDAVKSELRTLTAPLNKSQINKSLSKPSNVPKHRSIYVVHKQHLKMQSQLVNWFSEMVGSYSLSWIWSSRGNGHEEYYLLRCDAMYTGRT